MTFASRQDSKSLTVRSSTTTVSYSLAIFPQRCTKVPITCKLGVAIGYNGSYCSNLIRNPLKLIKNLKGGFVNIVSNKFRLRSLSNKEAMTAATAAPCEKPIIPTNGPSIISFSAHLEDTCSFMSCATNSIVVSSPLICFFSSSAKAHAQYCQSPLLDSASISLSRSLGVEASAARILWGAVGKMQSTPNFSRAFLSAAAFLEKVGPFQHQF